MHQPALICYQPFVFDFHTECVRCIKQGENKDAKGKYALGTSLGMMLGTQHSDTTDVNP